MNASGGAELDRIRDTARDLAKPLGMQREFQKLDGIIGALLATRARGKLKTKEGRLVAKGIPADMGRLRRFEILAAKHRTEPLPRRSSVATEEPARSNFAFLESYFSNYVEGTEFAIEEAKQIALEGRIALALMQAWTVALDYADVDALIETVKKINALERSRRRFKLTMPDRSALMNQ